MSRLPQPRGGANPNQVKTTSTFTRRLPGSNATQTVTKTHTREVKTCKHTSQPGESLLAGCGQCEHAAGPSRPSGLRPPGPRPGTSVIQAPRAIPQRSMQQPRAVMPQAMPAPTRSAMQSTGAIPKQIPRPGGIPQMQQQRPPSGIQAPRGVQRLQGAPGPPQASSTMIQRGMMQQPRAVAGTSRIAGPSRIGGPSTSALPQKSMLKQPSQAQAQPSDPACPPCADPDALVEAVELDASRQLARKSAMDVSANVFARSMRIDDDMKQRKIETPAGRETLLQQTMFKRRVERDEGGEKVTKSVSVMQMDEKSGKGTEITMSVQQKEPKFAARKGRKEVVTIKETVSVTPSYTTSTKDVTVEDTRPLPCLDTTELRKLVEEEKEDVENTLKMAPPDLVLMPEKYHIKKRLQKLRLTSESMVLLEQSLVNPKPIADEVQMETPPEAFANIMHTVEKGMQPLSAPDQIFNTLFSEKSTTEPVITVSSVGPGPLQDVVVPTDLTKQVHGEIMTAEVNKLAERLQNVSNAVDIPGVEIFSRVMGDDTKKARKGKKPYNFRPLENETVPWGPEDIEPVVTLIGADPSECLEASNVVDLETSGNLETELSAGIEYFVDADPIQYVSRVQLRGSQPPPWFPGYIMALPDFPETVRVMRNADEVFYSGWKSVQPKIFPDENLSILEH